MAKDKYPSIFSPQMEVIVFIILQIFYATRAVLKIGEYPRIFAHVTLLDQSCARENIQWIIINDKIIRSRFLSRFSINLLASYPECRPLIGYSTHYLFCDR